MLREEDQREHTQDTRSADAAVLYRAEWLWRVHERGLDNISDRKPPGARSVLWPEDIEIVRATLRHPEKQELRFLLAAMLEDVLMS